MCGKFKVKLVDKFNDMSNGKVTPELFVLALASGRDGIGDSSSLASPSCTVAFWARKMFMLSRESLPFIGFLERSLKSCLRRKDNEIRFNEFTNGK